MRRTVFLVLMVLIVVAGGCGGGETPPPGEVGAGDDEEEQGRAEQTSGYLVVLRNAVSDSLRGDATFGTVIEPGTEDEVFVIDLASEFDFAGGLFIVRRGDELPSTGRKSLEAVTDSAVAVPPEGFRVIYRQGMLRNLRSRSGAVTFETVTDTLITGTLDATLRGFVSAGSRRLSDAEVHARGRFEARPGTPGYVIGL